EALGTSLGRNRTYAELETAMFNQSEVVWRYLTGMDSSARKDFALTGQVVYYWYDRWKAELGPGQEQISQAVLGIQHQFEAVGDSVFHLVDTGRRAQGYQLAVAELRNRIQPALTALNRQIYRQQRETSVQAAFGRVEAIVATERRILVGILVATLVLGLASAWLMARGLVRPINQLRGAMAVVGSGDLDHPLQASTQDEIGDLARAFAGMTDRLRQSRTEMVRLNLELAAKVAQVETTQSQLVQSEKLASLGEMAAGVAHEIRNPLGGIKMATNLLSSPEVDGSPLSQEMTRSILSGISEIEGIINNLLDWARDARLERNEYELHRILDPVVEAVAAEGRARGV
ncbi:MAG TPA: HAMP domain-containing protein, partial [Gemmatimonadales bacterium]|nr:HAMP domain-containing protein [Gemmatimonadales bacterium]